MITLCIDTSYKHLVIALYKEDTLLDAYEQLCERNQSEMVFPIIDEIFRKNNLTPNDIKSVVITKGPGSYTGVRIAMTIAKILCSLNKLPLYTISTLELYKVKDFSIIDAKGKKVFVGGDHEQLMTIEEAKKLPLEWIGSGDTHLIDREGIAFSIAQQFINKKYLWEKVEDVDALVPTYLKEAI